MATSNKLYCVNFKMSSQSVFVSVHFSHEKNVDKYVLGVFIFCPIMCKELTDKAEGLQLCLLLVVCWVRSLLGNWLAGVADW